MPRPRKFDKSAVLDGAVRHFRRNGIAATSIKDLESATGLTNGSIYNSFGDKEGVLRAALEHYMSIGAARRKEHFAGARGIGGVEALFLSLLQTGDCDVSGCLITNVAVELGGGPARPEIALEFAALAEDFRRELRRDLPSKRVEPAVARLLMLYQGLLVLIRASHPIADCQAAITDEFRSLRLEAKS